MQMCRHESELTTEWSITDTSIIRYQLEFSQTIGQPVNWLVILSQFKPLTRFMT